MTLEYSKTHATMHLESSGIVASLFKVDDLYQTNYQDGYCSLSSVLDSKEGKRHHETRVTYDRARNRASYVERDILKSQVLHEGTIDTPACVSEVVAALLKLRDLRIEPGQSTQTPVSDGRRAASVKIQAEEREQLKTLAGTFPTIRYEADLMNGVVYTRKGRVHIWFSDDSARLAVQIRLRMNFPIGTVTLQLEKVDSAGKPAGSKEASQ